MHPAAGAGQILDFNFDTWGKAADALAGDPPRDDYQLIATAEAAKVAPVAASGKGGARRAPMRSTPSWMRRST